MCGYCIESVLLTNLEREKQGKPVRELEETLIAGPYLQESDDLLAAMNKIRTAAYRKKVVALQMIPSEVLICRSLDILFGEGFDSSLYQKLLRSRTFKRGVDNACSDEKLAALD